ncbi:MAG TPA: alpha-ketoacid dehydrogenase subunit beta [bacterium]|nr:alpha-ketoacid dehydrogenase subunit beta [bacterium]HOL34731.1 alpha-ketoacid dehydrogenase subunit beta [bacterium]HPP08324.1 alpha-ketoacid dehydrogenase subunit beta [bacterium]
MARLTIAEALRQAIREEMKRDESVYCIGEDIGIPGGWGGAFTVTLGLEKEFPDRIINTPISEAGFFGVALGSSLVGLRPIVDVQYGDFLFCAMDQIANQIAKLRYMSGGKIKTPIVIRAPVGVTGRGAQHSQMMEPFFQCLPGIKIVCPATAYDAKGLLKSAVRNENPVMIFEHKLLYGAKGARSEPGSIDASSEIPDEEYLIPIGKGTVRRQGTDITIVATLLMMHRACEAAEIVEKEGISVEVIDPRSLVPFDWEIVKQSIAKTGRLIIVEESPRRGGIGAEIAATVAEEMLDFLVAPVKRIAAPDTPAPFSPVMEKFYVPDTVRIVQAIKEMMSISS